MAGDVVVRDVVDPDEIRRFVDIQMRVWGSEVTPHHIIVAIKEVGGVVKGAYVDGELVGFVYGFIGRFHGKYCIYSHQLAVLPEYQDRGIGAMLKQAQREWSLENGYDLVIWTFDPARSKNAWLNINKLGTIARTYLPNHYGTMEDELNRGVPSDRFMTEWHIASPWIEKRPRKRRISEFDDVEYLVRVEEINGTLYPRTLEPSDSKYLAVEIPRDFDNLGEATQQAKIRWKLTLRKVFRDAFSTGYVASYFVKTGEHYAYILTQGFDPYDESTW